MTVIRSIIPPTIGRPAKHGAPPGGRWRRLMKRMLRTKRSRRRCGYNRRYQIETVNSMMKRNLGSALGGKTARSTTCARQRQRQRARRCTTCADPASWRASRSVAGSCMTLAHLFDERAGICQYDGNMSLGEAERIAYRELARAVDADNSAADFQHQRQADVGERET